jgi:Mg-chelatase subunit ChlD
MESTLSTYAPNTYALRIKGVELATGESNRIPSHFIVLLDNSGSMGDGDSPFGRSAGLGAGASSKMENVKRCLDAMLACLSADDMLSIITFESSSTIHLQCMTVSEAHKAHIQSIIGAISPQDMTNLSAGLGNVRAVLATAPPQLKTGIILLTDGHINQGITESAPIKAIIQDILQSRAGLSFHCVGYGTDHNDVLLKDIALETQGSYNIVNTLEDVATAFGDTLGGLMSCVAQNVEARLPADAVVRGPFKTRVRTDGVTVPLGDLYAGTERIILYSASSMNQAQVHAMVLPLLTPVAQTLEAVPTTERSIDIELTAHRYTCTDILRRIQEARAADPALNAAVQAYKDAIADSAYDSSPITAQLRAEVAVMERALVRLTSPFVGVNEDSAVLSQHISYYGLGRGFSTPSRPPRPTNAPWAPARANARANAAGGFAFRSTRGSSPSDPVEDVEADVDMEEEENPAASVSPTTLFQNRAQRMVSNTMRTVSSQHH